MGFIEHLKSQCDTKFSVLNFIYFIFLMLVISLIGFKYNALIISENYVLTLHLINRPVRLLVYVH